MGVDRGAVADYIPQLSTADPDVFGLALVGPAGSVCSSGEAGVAFNAISLEPGTGRPTNPVINACAILTTSMVQGSGAGERFEQIRSLLPRCAGRDPGVDE